MHLFIESKKLKECGCEEDAKTLEKLQKASVAALHKSKLAIKALIAKTIQQDEQLNIKVKRVASIKGIGQVTSVALWFIQEALRRLKMEINWPDIVEWYHLPKARAQVFGISQR